MTAINLEPYAKEEIDILMNEPWEVSDTPFKLHAAYTLSCLVDMYVEPDINEIGEDDDEGEYVDVVDKNKLWGTSVPVNSFVRAIADIAADFNDAADNRKTIQVWGKSYSIRKVNAYDHNRLTQIFAGLPVTDGQVTISQDYFMNLSGKTYSILKPYEVTKDQFNINRDFFRKIVFMAESDDGWDKLTDIEVLVYCWGLYYTKYQSNNLIEFKNKYKKHIYVTDKDIIACLNDKSQLSERPVGMYAFSKEKIDAWNQRNGFESLVDTISQGKAEDYWYEVALQTTFRPIDCR